MPVISFWLNAFIPRTVSGYTQTLAAGLHVGKTAVPLPGVARTWPGNTFKDWNAGYLTDQRGFLDNVTASSRMHCWAEVDLGSLTLGRQDHTSSGTTEVNLSTGVQTGFGYADMRRCRFSQHAPPFGGVGAIFGASRGGSTMPQPVPHFGPGVRGSTDVRLVAAAGDPLVGMAADIDYNGTFTITIDGAGGVAIAFSGMIDAFPAYDCYATLNGVTKTLFTNSPPPGNTVASLLGGANRSVTGSASFP